MWPHFSAARRPGIGLPAQPIKRTLVRRSIRTLIILLLVCGAFPSFAQWTNQTIVLKPGWNSVYLALQPEPADCDTQFAGLPVESVWAWNKRFSTVQFIQDPSALIPGQPDWLIYCSPAGSNRVATSLYALTGCRAYLVRLANYGTNVSWTVKGRPLLRQIEWLPESFNFVGFRVDPAAPPTFQTYLAGSPAHVGQPVYRLNASGSWSTVNTATERPNAGEAYWVRCAGASSFQGPLSVTAEMGTSLDYGSSLSEQTLVIANSGTNGKTITLRQVPSALPPGPSVPALAGDVPLYYWVFNSPTNYGFFPLPTSLTNTIPAGGQWSLRLAIRRAALASYAIPSPYTNAIYQKLFQVTDGAGGSLLVPATAQSFAGPASGTSPHPGLWVGYATISRVSGTGDPAPTNTPSPFQFRLILHQGTNGQENLLRQVLVAASQTFSNQYLLITDLRSNSVPYDRTVRTFTSPAFGFNGKLRMYPNSVDFSQESATLTVTNILWYTNALNPFVHVYHPDHNNLDDRSLPLTVIPATNWPANPNTTGPSTTESFTITRYITMTFRSTDPEGLPLPDWGSTQVGGNYSERITGLHKSPLFIEGFFRLYRAASTGWLDAGL